MLCVKRGASFSFSFGMFWGNGGVCILLFVSFIDKNCIACGDGSAMECCRGSIEECQRICPGNLLFDSTVRFVSFRFCDFVIVTAKDFFVTQLTLEQKWR